jgi:hypothetical protein
MFLPNSILDIDIAPPLLLFSPPMCVNVDSCLLCFALLAPPPPALPLIIFPLQACTKTNPIINPVLIVSAASEDADSDTTAAVRVRVRVYRRRRLLNWYLLWRDGTASPNT